MLFNSVVHIRLSAHYAGGLPVDGAFATPLGSWLAYHCFAFLLWMVESDIRSAAALLHCIQLYERLVLGKIDGSREEPGRQVPVTVTVAVTANLALLGYYNYANFFLQTWDVFTTSRLSAGQIILPLGISFFTFTQIAFLIDMYRVTPSNTAPSIMDCS